MINLQKLDNKKDVYAFSLDGSFSQQDVNQFYEMLKKKAADHKKVRVLSEIKDFPKLQDFKNFSEIAAMKTQALETVEKYAVVSDKSWIETMLPVSNMFTPGLPIKHFEPAQRDQAIAWLESDEPETKAGKNSDLTMQAVPGATNVYEFTIDGTITDDALTSVYRTFAEKAKDNKLNLLVTIKDFDGFDNVQTMLHGIKSDLKSIGDVRKMALLSDKQWAEPLIKVADFLTPDLEAKAYGLPERTQAVAWLKS